MIRAFGSRFGSPCRCEQDYDTRYGSSASDPRTGPHGASLSLAALTDVHEVLELLRKYVDWLRDEVIPEAKRLMA
jgi:hypothetical protein